MFGISVGRLITTVSKTLARSGVHPALSLSPVKGPVDGDEMSNCNWVASKLKDEWEEFFAEGIFTVLVPLYIKVKRSYLCFNRNQFINPKKTYFFSF